MRFKLVLSVHAEAYGNVLPISYQYELSCCISRLLMADRAPYEQWLKANGLAPADNVQTKVYAVSNLYIPRIMVKGDRLTIKAPRVQCWLSFMPETGTEEFVRQCLLDKVVVLGDRVSRVRLSIDQVSVVEPIEFSETMEYTSLAPIAVMAMRPDSFIEFLSPDNPLFAQFMFEELVERYERLKKTPYEGSRDFQFELLYPAKRKGVNIRRFTPQELRVIGFILKFRITMDVELQRFAYETGIGDKVNFGFGYIELLHKRP